MYFLYKFTSKMPLMYFDKEKNRQIQWKLLNVIALGQRESDNNNRMITISESISYERVIWGQKNCLNLNTLNE